MFKSFYGLTFNPFNKEIATKYSYNFYDFSEATARLKYLSEIKGLGYLQVNLVWVKLLL